MLSTLLIAVLVVVASSTAYMHLRGRDRFKLRRLLVEYSNWLAPYNALACLFARDRRPIQDLRDFPELDILRQRWETIRDEAAALFEGQHLRSSPRGDDLVFYSFFKRGWKRFYLRWYGDFLPSARHFCPRTVELLDGIPSVRGAMIAAMQPRSRLGRHRDPFAGTLRYHLGLITPNEGACRIWIDGQPHVWRDGEDILFDSSYLHKARNDTDRWRIVLFCDVERPMRNRFAGAVNRFVMGRFLGATRTPNLPTDPTGAANRFFAAVQPVRRAIAALRRTSPTAYYAVKIGVPVGTLIAIALSQAG